MRSSRNVRVQRPPAPCVEEEPVSLARELHGLTKVGEKPGLEGTCKRGTVDQYPIIMAPESPAPASVVSPSLSNPPGLGSVSSDDNSSGPRTPPPMPEPVIRIVEPMERDIPAPASVASRSKSRAPQRYQVPSQEQSPVRQPRPRSQSRSRDFPRNEGSHHPRPSPDKSAVEEVSRGRDYDQHSLHSQKSPSTRSKSLKYDTSTVEIIPSQPRPDLVTGYQSDSTMGRHSSRLERPKPSTISPSGPEMRQVAPLSSQPRTAKSSTPTLAERLEEKLRLRQELRDLSSDSEPEPSKRRRSRSISRKSIHASPAQEVSPPHEIIHAAPIQRAPSPPHEIIHAAPIQRAPEPQRYPPVSRGRASTVSSTTAPLRPALRSSSRAHGQSKSMSSDEAQAGSSKPHRTNSVKFLDDLPQRHSQTQLVTVPKAASPQRTPSNLGLCVTPCPRSTPVSGFQDWYTLKGLTHLNICPSCMTQIGHSRFRDYFIPSLPNNGEKIQCAFGNAWTRLAWTQMIKKEHQSLEMLYQMTRPPPGTPECPGRHKVKNVWHRIIEPETNTYLPRLHVCTSCARNVRILMPSHRDTFQPDSRPEEGFCAFVTTSPRFVQYIDLLDNAANHAKPSRRPDLREFLGYARRKIVLRDCQRDKPMRSGWHYMADLPELLACGDCYDEVVWPLSREKYAIAEDFYPKMRYLPGDGPDRCRMASCSLYSPRMRAKFREAVINDDFSGLKDVSLRRFEAERRFQDRKEELLDAEERGYRCDVEIRKAIEEWRRWE
ncbi:uncharacterized protein N7483_010577 [Penicillium malachiteum]|uniref:uncharacterized protein n=1 Tax=Penicillium malachiteum TaxID=1324776 RepID=UPI0025480029|nr:uncharacterized protein N7483_010577 [Penicillium malachiteum]KAJ5713396.1 hypothetical protein N7483_010577 [Penicillium malachiteum]